MERSLSNGLVIDPFHYIDLPVDRPIGFVCEPKRWPHPTTYRDCENNRTFSETDTVQKEIEDPSPTTAAAAYLLACAEDR